MEEEWKDVVGYEGSYEVSNFGRVKSSYLEKGGKHPIMKLTTDRHGYCRVGLRNKCLGKKMFIVSRLVALSFIPNDKNKPQVDHIDGCRSNNLASNLRWATPRENIKFSREKMDTSSSFVGVYDSRNGWRAQISIHSIQYYIGRFDNEEHARDAYLDVLENGIKAIEKYRTTLTGECSIVKGKWQARVKKKYLGRFESEEKARIAISFANNNGIEEFKRRRHEFV